MKSKNTIGNELRKPESIKVYSREYERDYSNKIGPGPAAY